MYGGLCRLKVKLFAEEDMTRLLVKLSKRVVCKNKKGIGAVLSLW